MKNPRKSARKRVCAALLSAVVCSTAAVVVAEDLYVQPNRLDVREGPGLLFDPVDSVTKSTKVTVLERTDDGWIKIHTPAGKEGYVFQKELAAKPPAAPGPFAGLNVTSDAEASQMGTAAASKGLEPEAETYAKNKSYSKVNLDKVIAMNKAVKGKEWMQFCKDGQVGPSKPKQ
ncbi:MAG TPA: SH3 domain-containing protein [Tepidisphaeraceae bacterium]|nr:SH3 domain-containing protein [Tepidisphaeraceae bacterium]